MAERKIMEAAESFSAYLRDGTPFVVVSGERFYSDDPVIAGRQHLFRELTVRSSAPSRTSSPGTETASAAPGTKRATTRPSAAEKDGGKA